MKNLQSFDEFLNESSEDLHKILLTKTDKKLASLQKDLETKIKSRFADVTKVTFSLSKYQDYDDRADITFVVKYKYQWKNNPPTELWEVVTVFVASNGDLCIEKGLDRVAGGNKTLQSFAQDTLISLTGAKFKSHKDTKAENGFTYTKDYYIKPNFIRI